MCTVMVVGADLFVILYQCAANINAVLYKLQIQELPFFVRNSKELFSVIFFLDGGYIFSLLTEVSKS